MMRRSECKENDPIDSTVRDSGFLEPEEVRARLNRIGAAQSAFRFSPSMNSDVDESRQQRLGRFGIARGLGNSQLFLPFDDAQPFRATSSVEPGPTDPCPPATLRSIGSLLSVFMVQDQRDALIGDLEERYSAILHQEGRRTATRWFWREVIHSCFSLALDALKRLSALEKLIERYRRIGS